MISIKDMDMVMDMAVELNTRRDGCNFPAIHIHSGVGSIELRFGIGGFAWFCCSLRPSTFYLLLYLYYNSIRVLLRFALLLYSLVRLFFVCIC